MINKRTKFIILAVLAVISLLLLIEKDLAPGLFSQPSPSRSFELLWRIVYYIQNNYIQEANPEQTMKGAFQGLSNSLDVLSGYLDQENVIKYSQRMDSGYKDVGVVLFKRYGSFPQVIGIIENSPAQKHGIQVGDIISALDEKPPQIMSLVETNLHLKSKDEQPVHLRILRDNTTEEKTVERASLFKEPISITPADGTSGILKIHRLYPPCVKKIKEHITSRLRSAKDPLILDLRNCSEGDIQEAQKLINIFLKAPQIGYFKRKEEPEDYLACPDNPELKTLPLVVWTNQATIGPAEIVAGVLQEFKRTKIIGLQTLGLTAKQKFFLLEDGSGLLLTSGIFHLNSGEKLWEKGVKPDVEIKREDQSNTAYLKNSF